MVPSQSVKTFVSSTASPSPALAGAICTSFTLMDGTSETVLSPSSGT
jgi:hypothetical protein